MSLTVKPLTADCWPALETLFGRAGASNGCWCMYWRIGPRYSRRPRGAAAVHVCPVERISESRAAGYRDPSPFTGISLLTVIN
jgi:hypothetical protein